MKYLNTFEDYNYGDIVQLVKSEAPIKSYLIDKYPTERNLIGRYGHGFSKTGLLSVLRFAKKQKDQILFDLVNNHLEFIKDMEFRKEAEKYNI
jgi:hypothetical protein